MNYVISNGQIAKFNETERFDFPKYTSQLINLANQNAQATRPNKIGQLSQIFPNFMASDYEKTISGWEDYYTEEHPDTFEKATEKIYTQVQNLKNAITSIDKNMVAYWVKDLIINKTFKGLYVQKAILAFLAQERGTEYRLATPEEEARGIDGFVGDIPYSIKPETYRSMGRLSESIEVKMIYYEKTETGLKIEVDE